MPPRVEADVRPMHEVIFLHVHTLGVGGLFPFLPDSPAWAGTTEPYPFVIFFGGEGSLGGGQAFYLLFW